jgi:hypothetical protein
MQEFFRNNYNSLKSEFKEETELMTEKRDSLMEKAVCIDGETPFITIGIQGLLQQIQKLVLKSMERQVT